MLVVQHKWGSQAYFVFSFWDFSLIPKDQSFLAALASLFCHPQSLDESVASCNCTLTVNVLSKKTSSRVLRSTKSHPESHIFPRKATAVSFSLWAIHWLNLKYITLLSCKYLCHIRIRLAFFAIDKLPVLLQIMKIQFLKMFSYCFFFPLLFISEELAIICSYSDVPEEELKPYFPHIKILIIEIHCFLFFLLPLNKGMY